MYALETWPGTFRLLLLRLSYVPLTVFAHFWVLPLIVRR